MQDPPTIDHDFIMNDDRGLWDLLRKIVSHFSTRVLVYALKVIRIHSASASFLVYRRPQKQPKS